jgi:hypothetical protein
MMCPLGLRYTHVNPGSHDYALLARRCLSDTTQCGLWRSCRGCSSPRSLIRCEHAWATARSSGSATCAIVNRFVILDGRRMLAIEGVWVDAPTSGPERSFGSSGRPPNLAFLQPAFRRLREVFRNRWSEFSKRKQSGPWAKYPKPRSRSIRRIETRYVPSHVLPCWLAWSC